MLSREGVPSSPKVGKIIITISSCFQRSERRLRSAGPPPNSFRRGKRRTSKNEPAGLKSETKMGPPGAIFAHFEGTFSHLVHSFAHFYAFHSGFREHLCFFAENSWKTHIIKRNAPKTANIAQRHSKGA